MLKCLSPEQLRQFRKSGVVFPLRALTADKAQIYRQACDDLELALGGKPRTIELRQMHLHFRWAYELATCGPVVDAAEDLLGPDVLVWATELFAKHPHDAQVSIGWHRDVPYMGLDPPHAVTAWIALSPSTPANGCMQFVPEPDLDKAEAEPLHPHGNAGVMVPAGISDADRGKAVDVVLAVGEMSLHSPLVLHGSSPNTSNEKRVGFVVRFVASSARPRHGRPPALLVRGEDRHGHFQLIGPPDETDLDQALARMRESAASHLDAMLRNTKAERRLAAKHGQPFRSGE